jgi:hypothetical protein
VFIDNFPDALPILYYRRTPGVNTPAARQHPTNAANAADRGLAAYYVAENEEYTTATALTTPNGHTFDQTKTDEATPRQAKLTWRLLESTFGNLNTPAKGGYMLLSAGPDRLYGVPQDSANPPPASEKVDSDNVVVVGGN